MKLSFSHVYKRSLSCEQDVVMNNNNKLLKKSSDLIPQNFYLYIV